MPEKLTSDQLREIYLAATNQYFGAAAALLVLEPFTPAYDAVRAKKDELWAEAELRSAEWKAGVGCTPEVMADFAARYGAQQRSIGHLQDGITTANAA